MSPTAWRESTWRSIFPPPFSNLSDRNGKVHAEMEVLGLAYVPGGDVAARFRTRKMKFDFETRQQFDDFLRHPLHYRRGSSRVVPGNYQFKGSLSHRQGSLRRRRSAAGHRSVQRRAAQLERHRPQPQRAADIARGRAGREPTAGKTPLIFRGNRIAVSGSDVLSKTGTAEAYFEIYEPLANGAAAVQLSMRLRLLDAQSNEQRVEFRRCRPEHPGQVRQ
jgi:hypothetical protein